MALLATELVNWTAIWKICIAALIGGVGVVFCFGILLLGLKLANNATTEGARLGSYALSGVCGLICVGVFAVGIYAMAQKPTSKAKKAHKTASAALFAPGASAEGRLATPAL